jgi:FRG domain
MVEFTGQPVSTLAGFVDQIVTVAKAAGRPLWFRGHRSAAYQLVPGLYRSLRPIETAMGTPVPRNFRGHSSATVYAYPNFQAMLLEFKRFAAPHLQAMSRPPADEFEWIFLMQHYGVRTRLLDWTTDPLIALYFATRGDAAGTNRHPLPAAVFAMDPVAVNKQTVDIEGVISLNAERWDHYLEPHTFDANFPICVAPAHIDPRVIAQSSVFTLHGAMLPRLDSYVPVQPHIAELEIDAEAVSAIKAELMLLGYDRARVFPELSTIAERVLRAGDHAFDRWEPDQHDG